MQLWEASTFLIRYKSLLWIALDQYRNLTITVKSTLYDLYVDGVRQNNLTHANNWTFPDVVPITPTNRLIGVMAIDSTETCAGILGSVTDDFLVTDGINWRCSVIPDVHWFELGWDDTAWPLAYPLKYNETHNLSALCNDLNDVPGISENAYWIWAENILEAPNYSSVVFCRGYLRKCLQIILRIANKVTRLPFLCIDVI